jgi:hypothetical protein
MGVLQGRQDDEQVDRVNQVGPSLQTPLPELNSGVRRPTLP